MKVIAHQYWYWLLLCKTCKIANHSFPTISHNEIYRSWIDPSYLVNYNSIKLYPFYKSTHWSLSLTHSKYINFLLCIFLYQCMHLSIYIFYSQLHLFNFKLNLVWFNLVQFSLFITPYIRDCTDMRLCWEKWVLGKGIRN